MTYQQSVTAPAVASLTFGDMDGLPAATVIPAASGTTAALITCEFGEERPQLRDLRVAYPAVIGWRFSSECLGAQPVFTFDPFAHPERRVAEAFVSDDDAVLRSLGAETPVTLAEAKAQVLRRARQAWEERNQLTAYLAAIVARRRATAPSMRELVAA